MTVFNTAFSAVAFYEGRSTRLRHRLPEVRRERGRRRLPPGVRAQSGPETARALVTESFGREGYFSRCPTDQQRPGGEFGGGGGGVN